MSAAIDCDPPLPLSPSSPPLLSSRLLEKELGACAQTRGLVPDHLSQTSQFVIIIFVLIKSLLEYFSNPQEHSSIKTKPQSVHFHGYKIGRLHQQTIVGKTSCLSLPPSLSSIS